MPTFLFLVTIIKIEMHLQRNWNLPQTKVFLSLYLWTEFIVWNIWISKTLSFKDRKKIRVCGNDSIPFE